MNMLCQQVQLISIHPGTVRSNVLPYSGCYDSRSNKIQHASPSFTGCHGSCVIFNGCLYSSYWNKPAEKVNNCVQSNIISNESLENLPFKAQIWQYDHVVSPVSSIHTRLYPACNQEMPKSNCSEVLSERPCLKAYSSMISLFLGIITVSFQRATYNGLHVCPSAFITYNTAVWDSTLCLFYTTNTQRV